MTSPPTDDVDSLLSQLRALGLPVDQARVLLALLHTEAANSIQLSATSGVARTSIYRIMGVLTDQDLATRLPTPGPAVWTTPGWDRVLDTLAAIAHVHLRQQQLRIRHLRQTVASPPARTVENIRHHDVATDRSSR